MNDHTKVFLLLNGLEPEFESFITSMLKPPILSYKEVVPLLQSHETMKLLNGHEENAQHQFIFYTQRSGFNNNHRGRGKPTFSSHGRGFYSYNRRQQEKLDNLNQASSNQIDAQQKSSNNKGKAITNKEKGITYQICSKANHSALRCWFRYNGAYKAENATKAFAVETMADNQDQAWFPDSRTTSHITSNPGMFDNLSRYKGKDSILVGDGNALEITHVGDTKISSKNDELELRNVLVVLEIKRNLVSVSQLTKDLPVDFCFSHDRFQIKNMESGRGDLYVFATETKDTCFSNRQKVASLEIWHRRLTHVNFGILKFLSRQNQICSSNVTERNICVACAMAKSSCLPFLSIENGDSQPFDILHCDLWGHSPVNSVQGMRYYAIFVDDSTKFSQKVVSLEIWHRRLTHFLNRQNQICSSNVTKRNICVACAMTKSSCLPFFSLENGDSQPFDILHCDLWGHSPVNSIQGMRYYAIFVDDSTKFSWLFP
ncbi:Retrovirus-related Pol polyprotein from transposon TNT 1-94 [Nymphaea thermarum]|nr:Retrovirus-related Pol polyprotein from transposon TNT 1-94 [Nymphaea thermarum]